VKRLLSVLDGKEIRPLPIWLMRQAGRYLPEYREARAKAGSFWSMCMDPSAAAEVTLQPIRRFGFDAAILFSDILVVPFAMGCDVIFEDGPSLAVINDIRQLQCDETVWARHLAPVYETVKLVRRGLGVDIALLGFAGAPWTLATYMAEGRGSSDRRAAKLWGYRAPRSFRDFLDAVADCVAFHLIRQIEAGCDAVQIFDSWAGDLPARHFGEWVIAPTKRIVKQVRETYPQAKLIGFPRAATLSGYEAYACETGVDGISLDTTVPMEWAMKSLPANIAVQGNLDPIALLAGGEELRRATDAIVDAMRGRPLIFNLGHGVVPETPPEHVTELVEHVRAAR